MSEEPASGSPKADWMSLANEHAERLKPVKDLLTEGAKLGASLATVPIVLGAVLLLSYVHRVGAPLPPFEASTGVFLILLAAILMIGVVILGTFVVWPFMTKVRNPELVRTVFSDLYQAPAGLRLNFKFFRSYTAFFLPFLCLIGAASIEIFLPE